MAQCNALKLIPDRDIYKIKLVVIIRFNIQICIMIAILAQTAYRHGTTGYSGNTDAPQQNQQDKFSDKWAKNSKSLNQDTMFELLGQTGSPIFRGVPL